MDWDYQIGNSGAKLREVKTFLGGRGKANLCFTKYRMREGRKRINAVRYTFQ